MDSKEPKFIVFEGIDCSGKTSQIEKFKEYLINQGKKVIVTKEPWPNGYRQEIKNLIKSEESNEREILDLFLRDRTKHLKELIMPKLSEGYIVLCDRYLYSTLAYQQKHFELDSLINKSKGHRNADICFFIDISPKEAMKRLKKSEREEIDERYEKLPYQKELRKRFKKVIKTGKFPEITEIDGIGSKEEVFKQIVNSYKKLKSES